MAQTTGFQERRHSSVRDRRSANRPPGRVVAAAIGNAALAAVRTAARVAGTAAGTAVGVARAFAGKGSAKKVDAVIEEADWRERYAAEPYRG